MKPVVLVLPDVAQLVGDEVVGGFGERLADEDQRTHLVAVEAPEPRQPEQPRDVQDPHVGQADRTWVEVEPVEALLGAGERRDLLGAASISPTMRARTVLVRGQVGAK